MQDSQDIFSPVLETIYTKRQRVALTMAIESLLPQLYIIKTDVESKINELFPYEIAQALLSLSQKKQIDLKNPVAIQDLLRAIQKKAEEMPTCSITLAFHPSGTLLKKISQWLRESFHHTFIIDFVVDSKIVAGAVISYQGAYRDYSFRAKFQEITEKKNFLEEIGTGR